MAHAQPSTLAPARRRWRWRRAALLPLAVLLAWIGFDLYGPRSHSLRAFDPLEVARLETDMWRSYYDRERVKLFNQLAELMRTQYGMPLLRSYAVALDAAQAAFIFKDGKGRSDYERALPDLVEYYGEIRAVGDIAFDVERVARLELEWWIIHRERKTAGREALDRSLSELPAAIYGMPAERFAEHARLRAEAMLIRDERAEAGAVSEEDWRRIAELLRASWQSLYLAVQK